MTVTVCKIEGRWWFEQDVRPGARVQVTHVIRVPDDSEFIDLVDASRSEVPLHALRMYMPRELEFNAGFLTELAGAGNSDAVAIITTIV